MAQSTENGTQVVAIPRLGPIFTKLVRDLKYKAPVHDDTRPALEAAMLEYAIGSGAPYESEYAQRYFDVGLTLACVCFSTFPFLYIIAGLSVRLGLDVLYTCHPQFTNIASVSRHTIRLTPLP